MHSRKHLGRPMGSRPRRGFPHSDHLLAMHRSHIALFVVAILPLSPDAPMPPDQGTPPHSGIVAQ